MRLPVIKGSRARQATRRRVVRHVARYLAVRLEHSDEGEDLQLALLLRRHLRDVAALREERVLALDDVKALHAVAEERGHRDAAAFLGGYCVQRLGVVKGEHTFLPYRDYVADVTPQE